MILITVLSRIAAVLLVLAGSSNYAFASSEFLRTGQQFEVTRDYKFYSEATLPFVTYLSGHRMDYSDLEKTDPAGSIRCNLGANALGQKRIRAAIYLVQKVSQQTQRGVDTVFIDFSLPESTDPHREGFFWMCSREENSSEWRLEDLEATVDHGVRF